MSKWEHKLRFLNIKVSETAQEREIKRVWLDWAIKTTVENDAKCPVRIFGILPPYPFFAPNFTCNTKINDGCLVAK